jgi:hypothetical protein
MSHLTCPACAGTGVQLDQPATAAAMRQARLDAAVPVARLAAAMGHTRSYTYQLERAERTWTPQLVAAWTDAVRTVAATLPAKRPRARRAPRQPTQSGRTMPAHVAAEWGKTAKSHEEPAP